MILEDTNHTGVCDSYKVFVQDKALFAPLGICVLGNKVIVAQWPPTCWSTPSTTAATTRSARRRSSSPASAAPTTTTAVHSGVFGPDGRFYFNCGNEGTKAATYGNVTDGKPVVDRHRHRSRHGRQDLPRPFQAEGRNRLPATAWPSVATSTAPTSRSSATTSAITTSSRVDSFGTVWQSDNDDDGNQGVRINYVMEGGNFGYTGPDRVRAGDRDMQPPSPARPARKPTGTSAGRASCPTCSTPAPARLPASVCLRRRPAPRICTAAPCCTATPAPTSSAPTSPAPSRGHPAGFMKPVTRRARPKPSDEADPNAGAGYEAEAVDYRAHQGQRPLVPPRRPLRRPRRRGLRRRLVRPRRRRPRHRRHHDWHNIHGRVYRLAPKGYEPAATPGCDLSTRRRADRRPQLAQPRHPLPRLREAASRRGSAATVDALKKRLGEQEPAAARPGAVAPGPLQGRPSSSSPRR